MAQRLFLVVSIIVCLAPSIHTMSQLMFANGTKVDITRTGCGVTKFCVNEPENCDPAAGSCLFASVMAGPAEALNGSSLSITLSGESNEYVALGLTANSTVGTTMVFVCGQTNRSLYFFVTQEDNSNNDGILTSSETPVEDIQGQVNGSVIQCSFTIPNINATVTGSSHVTTFVVKLGTGVINGTKLGPFSLVKMEGPLDLDNLPNNDTQMMNNTAIPMDNTTMPMISTTTPMNNATSPMNNATMSMNNATMPMSNTTMPMSNTTRPTSGTSSQNISSQNISSTFSSSASLLLWSFLTWSALQRM